MLYLPYGKYWNYDSDRNEEGGHNKAARRYESTLAVFRLTEVLEKAVLKEERQTKPDDKNQKPYSNLLIMLYDGIKLTVGVQKSTQEKVQYCLTALGSTA